MINPIGALGLVDKQYLDMKWFITLSAEGFQQAEFHFCASFGSRGLYNFGSEVGKTETVDQAEFRQKDQRKALLISLYSALIGIAVAVLGFCCSSGNECFSQFFGRQK